MSTKNYMTFWLLLALLSTSSLQASTWPSLEKMPIENYLNEDGSLAIPAGFTGSLNTAGYHIHLDECEGPIALPMSGMWSPLGDGVNGVVRALAIGPSGDLFVGGFFTQAGGQPANRIAKWDGANWSALGDGVNDIVYALAIGPSGDLFVGGFFTQAGGQPANNIAKWDGANWSALGDGVNNFVLALAIGPSGDLFVGGGFGQAGGQPANRIAKWDGANWSALGDGVNSTVRALAIGPSGELFVGGSFTQAGGQPARFIAKWDGANWSPLGDGVNSFVNALAIGPSGELFVGGVFSQAGGQPDNRRIAKFIPPPPCDIEITNVATTPETCDGEEDGTLTITATCTSCDGILYSIDGGTTLEDNNGIFTGLAPDTYMPYVEDSGDGDCNAMSDETMVTTQEDTEDPSITCPSNVEVDNDAGECAAVVNYDPATATDNCDMMVDITYSQNSGTSFNVGSTTVTATATDDATNTATCSFNVTVNDTENPTANCPGTQTVGNDAGQCGANVNFSIPNPTDNCPGATSTENLSSGSFFDVGATTVTVTATDASSNTGTCTFSVVVNDTEPPTANCPTTQTVNNDVGQCGANVTFTIPAPTDNCDAVTTASSAASPQSGDFFDVGSTTVTVTATDGAGNTGTCTFSVVVNDTEPPTANCPTTQTVNNDVGQCGANVTFTIPAPTDNCDAVTTASSAASPQSGDFFDVGSTTVTVTATDGAGNTGTCTFNVEVNDTEAPVFTSCPNDIEVNNDAGQCGAIVNYDVAYTENCAFGSVVFEQTAGQGIGTLFPVGITTNTFTLTDASGNTATPCTFNVIVNDTENPTANCPGTQTVDNDPGICGANVSFSIPNPSDNCPGATSMANPASGSLFNVGTTPVTVTATDATGNTSECTFDVVVNDTEAPTMLCNSFDVTLVGNSATITTSQMDGGSTDNCGIISLVAIPSSFNCSTLGAQTVSLTGTDAGGNSSTCTGTVTVIDNNPPTAICATNPTVNLASDGTTTVAASFFDGGSSAVCGGVTFMADMTDFDCDDVGNTIPVVLTVTATSNSQTATCTAMVTVEDPQSFCCAPANAVCNNFEVALGSNGMVTIDPSNVGGGSTAECGLMSETVMPNMFDCDDAGTTTSVTYTIVDINGESSNCMANVTITSVAPEVPTADVTMAMGCAGVTGGDVSVVDPMNGDLEVSWLVLEAPMGATITMDDILAPGTADSHYRTTVSGEPYTLRIKSNNSVTTGTYSFKAFFTNTATGCVSDNTTEEFTVVINDLPADPVAVQMSSEFCSNSGVGNGQKRARIDAPAGADEGTIWILTDAPTGSQFDGMEPIEFAEGETNSEFRITGGSKGNTVTMRGEPDNNGTPVYGTWTFDVRVEDSNTGCTSGTETGYFITTFENPADPVAATATKAFCVNPDLVANLANTGINVSNSLSANEKVVWVMTSAPANSPYSVETQLTTDDCGDPFKNLGTFAVANTSKVLRVNDIANAVPGTYTFDAYIENCETGCVSEVTSGFSITVNAAPSVMITADLPIGIGRDLCLGQEDVQYNAVVTSTDGGTYSYLWCAYNSGDGSGTCFNGFDNNTAQDPKRDWTSSTGAKSVGVTATSDVAGCEAEDLYSFEVVAPTMLECPADIVATLITNPVTYDCVTDITFNNPMVMPGPCDPVNLTIEITGPNGAGPEMVTPGEEYVFTVVELGLYTVTYNLVDAVGNTSTCSFDITVEGLPCGWVDNGGIGTCAGTNSSDYDLTSETFSVSSNGCVPAFPYTGDNQAFINTQLCGDGYIEVFVDNITAKGFAGISLRESQAPGAKKVEIGTDNVARIIRAARVIDGYPVFPQELVSFDKFWLKIERTGNSFRASASTDGVSYTPYLFQTIMMGECLEAGLWAYSTNPEDVVTATFNNVTVVEYGGAGLQAPVTNLAQSQTDLGAFDVSLTPNPAKEQVNINLEQLMGQEVTIRLFNINGQLMQQQPIEAVGAATHRLDLSNLPQGAYWVQVQSASGQKTMKLIKQ